MPITIIAIITLCAFAAIVAALQHNKGAEAGVIDNVSSDCSSCAGTGGKCEQECMMEAATREIVYFDDEELDAYKGRQSDGYTDDEAAQFGEVMYTMRQDEVREWTRSLTLRGISVPDQIKDEMIMLIGEPQQ